MNNQDYELSAILENLANSDDIYNQEAWVEAYTAILAWHNKQLEQAAIEARIDSLLAAKRRIYETDAFELGLALGIIDSELKKLGWTPGELKAQQEEL